MVVTHYNKIDFLFDKKNNVIHSIHIIITFIN